MKRINLNDHLLETLGYLKEDVALCDAAGNIVATVQRSSPWVDPEDWERLTPDISPEQWQQLSQSEERGISSQEMLRELREQS